jgi:predicted phosphodiesterase
MILVTGDTHGNIDFNKIKLLSDKKILTMNDYLIIAGDFGAIWDKNTLDSDLSVYENLNFNILFVDGNHENFNLLNSFPVQKWNGGDVHVIRDNIKHLKRGQVFIIDNKKILTFGGATSIDKYFRTENISWWKEEVPTIDDLQYAKSNLEKYNNQVDYIITHSIDEHALAQLSISLKSKIKVFEENYILNWIAENVTYKHWYFGHFHLDVSIDNNKTCLYNDIIELK